MIRRAWELECQDELCDALDKLNSDPYAKQAGLVKNDDFFGTAMNACFGDFGRDLQLGRSDPAHF